MKNLKILHAPTTVGGNSYYLSKAEKELGYDSYCLAISQNQFKFPCDEVILIGSAAEEISFCLVEKTKRTRAGDLEEAVLLASKAAEPSGVVLFSPGCASFDMFSDFRHRGETYKKYVDQL